MTPAELTEMNLADLRKNYAEAITVLSPKQLKLIEGMLAGKPKVVAGKAAGYALHKPDYNVIRALALPYMVKALALGREIASRGAETTAEWLRTELKDLMDKAKEENDSQTVVACAREFAKIDGLYQAEQMKLMHANHEGGPLQRDIDDTEWALLARLHHKIRDGEEYETHMEQADESEHVH